MPPGYALPGSTAELPFRNENSGDETPSTVGGVSKPPLSLWRIGKGGEPNVTKASVNETFSTTGTIVVEQSSL